MAELKQVFGWSFPAEDCFMSAQMKSDGSYQKSHWQRALTYVKDWTIACDLGAHVGTFSRPLSERFERVIAVEPSASTYAALVANMNRFGCKNVETRNIAVGAASGKVHMVLDGRGLELGNTGARYMKVGGDIPCEAIDSWNLPALGFLKCDIEGAECAAMTGAALTIARFHPVILFEQKGFGRLRFGEAADAVPQLLTSLGYHQTEVVGCDRIWTAS